MPEPQKRTIGAKKKIGGGSSAPPAKEEPVAEPPAEKPRKGKKVLVTAVAALALVGIGIGASTFLLRPADEAVAAEEAVEAPPELGPVAPLEEPISVNLSNGGYLRLGLALQLPAAEGEEGGHGGGDEWHGPDVSRVRDIAITHFSGRDITEVNDPAARETLRAELLHSLQATFGEHEVLDVYFTDFVTQ